VPETSVAGASAFGGAIVGAIVANGVCGVFVFLTFGIYGLYKIDFFYILIWI